MDAKWTTFDVTNVANPAIENDNFRMSMHKNKQELKAVWKLLQGISLLASIMLFSLQARSQEVDKIKWLLLELPPYAVLVDGKPTDGVFDVKLRMIVENLPSVMHEYQISSIQRIKATIERDDQEACFALSLITPAHENRFYTAETGPVSPHAVIVREDVAAQIPTNSRGQVDILQLINNVDLRGIVNDGRSYSEFIDAQLAKRNAKSGLHNVYATQGNNNLLKLIGLGRADYTIEYEDLLFYQKNRDDSLKALKLKVLPIEGVPLLAGGIACPRSAWGRAVIIKIRTIVSKLAMKPEFQNRFNKWQSRESVNRDKTAIDKFYERLAVPVDSSKIPPAPEGPLPPWKGPI